MTVLDLVILVVLALGIVRGLMTGALRQIGDLIGVLLAFVVAVYMMEPAGLLVMAFIEVSEGVARLIGFVVLFVAVVVLVHVIVRILEAIVGALKLTVVNRIVGGGVGGFKALLVMSAALLVLGYVGIPEAPTREASVFYEPTISVLPEAWNLAARELPGVELLSRYFEGDEK